MDDLIKKQLEKKRIEKESWASKKDRYEKEYTEAEARADNCFSMCMKNALILSHKCQYQIDCCDEWVEFLERVI